jgi:predicted ArsR family transcriptional regulator
MKRRTDSRRQLVLAAIKSGPKTVYQVKEELRITYSNAFYTLTSLRDEHLCHVKCWVQGIGNKPMAIYAFGKGRNARVDDRHGIPSGEMMSVDAPLRTAVAEWAKLSKEIDHGDEQQEA